MPRKIPEIISEEEFKKIIGVITKPKHKLALMLGFYQAMRISEICNLQPDNVDKGQKIIRIKQGKGGKDRNIPISKEVFNGLKHLPIGLTPRAVQLLLKKYAVKAGIVKPVHPHLLRHSGASFYLNVKKWNLRAVQVFLGHSRVTTTQIYTHVNPENLVSLMWD